jgi:hypothetical protein
LPIIAPQLALASHSLFTANTPTTRKNDRLLTYGLNGSAELSKPTLERLRPYAEVGVVHEVEKTLRSFAQLIHAVRSRVSQLTQIASPVVEQLQLLQQFPTVIPEIWRRFICGLSGKAETLYQTTKNPLHVWNAYRLHRLSNIEPPKWTLEYFDRAGEELWKLHEAAARGEKIKTEDIAKAFEFGRVDLFSKFTEFPEWQRIATDVFAKIRNGCQETYAIDDVAKARGLSKSTVRLAWKRAQDNFPELPVSQTRGVSKT